MVCKICNSLLHGEDEDCYDLEFYEFREAFANYNKDYFECNKDNIRWYFMTGFESENGGTLFDCMLKVDTDNKYNSYKYLVGTGIITPHMNGAGVCCYGTCNHTIRGWCEHNLLELYSTRTDEYGVKVHNFNIACTTSYTCKIYNDRRVWFMNGKHILTYLYNSGFCKEDCTLSLYMLSRNCKKYIEKIKFGPENQWEYDRDAFKCTLDKDTVDNLLYTPCYMWLYRYKVEADWNRYAIARNYYDIYRFFICESPDSLYTYDMKTVMKFPDLENADISIVDNIPHYYGYKYYNHNFKMEHLNDPKGHVFPLYDRFTKNVIDDVAKYGDFKVLTFGSLR